MKTNFKDVIASKTKQALGSNLISLEAIKQNIQILDELRDFIPPLNQEESQQLEQNIIKYGCKDALLVWETTAGIAGISHKDEQAPAYVLIDGHNRYRICQIHALNFNIQLLSFASLKDVKDYMIDLQLGRRNLTPQQASYFRGLRYNNEKTLKGKYERIEHNAQNEHYAQSDELVGNESLQYHNAHFEHYDKKPKLSTAAKLSEEYKVSPATIRRDAEFAEGLTRLAPSFRNEILAGNQTIDKGLLQKIAKVKEVVSPIESADELMAVLAGEGFANKKAKAEEVSDDLLNCSNEIIATTKKILTSKDKNQVATLKALIERLESLI
ncbi:hypothetical protein [Flectobacillus major]|uniref:hypothetical protein n=1 Tax=Flectobacillus major TaxID=103 RepID=UPI0004124D8D|nr:hypothetical protein [Flectobacillus major]